MKVLSKAFTMKDTFTQDRFFCILSNWLKRDGALRAFGEALEGEGREEMKLAGTGCGFETLCRAKDGKRYAAARCTQETGGAVRTTDAILEQSAAGAQKVYVHISVSSGGAGTAAGARSDLVRMFAGSKYTEKGIIPVTDKPFTDPAAEEEWLIPAICGHTDDMAVVIVSQPFAKQEYDADTEALARALEGIACVVCADRGYTWRMRKRGYILPYNGAAAVYVNGAKQGLYLPDPEGGPFTDTVLQETLRFASAADLPSWDSIAPAHGSAPDDRDKDELLEDAFAANTSLEKEVHDLREQLAALSVENSRLLSRSARRRDTDGEEDCIIRKGDVPEFYDEEQYDMIISILQNALANCTADTRQKELLEQVLANNPIRGNGKEIFETVKRVFTAGRRLTAKDASDLGRVGIRIVSDNKHYKLVFKDNSKYMFILSKTPSDSSCSGRNMASEIISRLSVYRKA